MAIKIEDLPKINSSYKFNIKGSKLTWFNCGGNIKILFKAKNIDQLQYFLQHNNLSQEEIIIIGAGSNMLIKDGQIDLLFIKLYNDFSKIDHNDKFIYVGAACLNYNLSLYAKINKISGFEFLSTIPGSVGGSVAMNAGCYGYEMKDILYKVKAIDYNGNLYEFDNGDLDFSYRNNKLTKDYIFYEAIFKFNDIIKYDEQSIISNKMKDYNKKRNDTQPILKKTGGSTFKNPENSNYKSWQLIDKVGMRGYNINGAKFSDKHCNFIINYNNANSEDIIELINEARDRVYKKFKINLNTEIKIIG